MAARKIAVEVERVPVAGGTTEDDVVGLSEGAAPMMDQPLSDREILKSISFFGDGKAVEVHRSHCPCRRRPVQAYSACVVQTHSDLCVLGLRIRGGARVRGGGVH